MVRPFPILMRCTIVAQFWATRSQKAKIETEYRA